MPANSLLYPACSFKCRFVLVIIKSVDLLYFIFNAESPNTSLSNGQYPILAILEGGNVNISCTSTGGPVPAILWTLNNQPTTFNHTDVVTDATNTMTPGYVMSTLHIVNAQYPISDGIYVCTGSNIINGTVLTSNISITVQVQGKFVFFF